MHLQKQILAVLTEGKDLTLATVRPDGAPQATTVSYASDGLNLYFGCGAHSQKAANLAREARVSATINLPYADWAQIRGLSLGGLAHRLTESADLARAGLLFLEKFPEVAQYVSAPQEEMAMFRIEPTVFSLLDYSQGFGHTDAVFAADLPDVRAPGVAA
jgi:uncharacterized protein YhbP (UPF0306 family)